MAKDVVPIQMGEVPMIQTLDELQAAAEVLATQTAAYVISGAVESPYGLPITDNQQKIGALVHALNMRTYGWTADSSISETKDKHSDIGMHGNPYIPGSTPPDYLHYHRTPQIDTGTVLRVTFADATEAYAGDLAEIDDRLTKLLAEGKTDPRYADPESFRQISFRVGAVCFRLNQGPTGAPLLHNFETVGEGSRTAEITPILRGAIMSQSLLSMILGGLR